MRRTQNPNGWVPGVPREPRLYPDETIAQWHNNLQLLLAQAQADPLLRESPETEEALQQAAKNCDITDDIQKSKRLLSEGMLVLLAEERDGELGSSTWDREMLTLSKDWEELTKLRENSDLNSLRIAKQLNELDDGRRENNYISPDPQQLIEAPIEVDNTELVFFISFYHRERPTLKAQEWMLLGSQTLNDLRQVLSCLADRVFDGDRVRSACFFIENVFYNDDSPGNLDYSQTIIDWAKNPARVNCNPAFKLFRKATMQETLLRDLTLRLNQPYLFLHQGHCDHVIIFNEIRLIHKDDSHTRQIYPRQVFQSKVRHRKCRMCDAAPASKVTYGDSISGENPCFFCESCYHALHYDANNTLIYENFRVFDYYHE